MARSRNNDIFERLHPSDGFRVKRVETARGISLHVGIWQGGELTNPFGATPEDATTEILEHKDASAVDLGRTTRLELVLDAICRYFTTGGDWDELQSAMATARRVIVGGLTYPGYDLIDSYSNTEGNYEHVFVQTGTDKVVLWVEDQFIDRKTIEQLRREQTTDWTYDESDAAEDPSASLLGFSDPEDQGEADFGADAAEEPPLTDE